MLFQGGLSVSSVGVSFFRPLIKDIFQDCWMSHNRTSDGQLQPDPTRFPSGMKALGDYVSMLSLPYSFNTCHVSSRFYLVLHVFVNILTKLKIANF